MAGDPLKKGCYTNFGNKIGLFPHKVNTITAETCPDNCMPKDLVAPK